MGQYPSLKAYNTFGVDVRCTMLEEVSDLNALRTALSEKGMPHLILGGGSNVLFTKDFEGLVIKNNLRGIELLSEDDDTVLVKVGAGEGWHRFVLYCIERGWGGIENLSLIPGTVGAAPMQNIGAYGVQIEDVFESLEALNKETLELEVFKSADCQFGYRQSVFKNVHRDEYVITSVTLRLLKSPELNTSYGAISDTLQEQGIENPSIRDLSNAVIEIRQSKLPDPAEIGNAGSFFKNPVIGAADFEGLRAKFEDIPGYELRNDEVKVPAAWLIEHCGWKGKRIGNIGVHKNQALVLVNYGGGNGADIKRLAEDIQSSVADKFGIALELEVNVV